jgi:hypothetical protein
MRCVALLVLVLMAACTPGLRGPASASIPVPGKVSASPTCPVVRNPPDPACSPRPVPGAVIVVLDGTGSEVARATSGPDGGFLLHLPSGTYQVVPQPVNGFVAAPSASDLTLDAGSQPPPLDIVYDTGIR